MSCGMAATASMWTGCAPVSPRRAARVAKALATLGILPVLQPQAGLFLWCRLPAGIDAAALARAAMERGLVLAPGNVFSLSQTATDLMRFNVSQMSDPHVFALLGDCLAAQRA